MMELSSYLPRSWRAIELPIVTNFSIFCGNQCPYCKASEDQGHQWRVWSKSLGHSVCRYCKKDATW